MDADSSTVTQQGATISETFPSVLAGAPHGGELTAQHPADSVHRSAGQCS